MLPILKNITTIIMRSGLLSGALLLLVGSSQLADACTGDVKVTSQGDLDSIGGCHMYQGSITINNVATPKLKFKGVQMIQGDVLVKDNDALSHLDLGDVQAIDGELKLHNNKLLSHLDMPKLTAIRSFELAVLPALAALSFPAGLSQVQSFKVSDTTAARIEGLKMSKMSQLVIDNNIYLKSLPMSNMTSISDLVSVSANSPGLSLDLSGLQSIKEGSFRNLAGVALDKLSMISGDVSFISNSFSELSIPEIDEIGGTLTIFNNMQLGKLDMPKLHHLGGALALGNNTALGAVRAFPNLEEVDGSLDITGAFDEVQLPKLSDVRGGLNVQTSSNKFSCSDMSKLKNGVIKGNAFVCKSAVAKPRSHIPGKAGIAGEGGDDASSGASKVALSSAAVMATAAGLFAYVF